MKRYTLFLVAFAIVALSFANSAQAATPPYSAPEVPVEAPAQLRDWQTITPGGATICALGDEYRFFVRAGATDKLLIFFEGGGACWDGETCLGGGEESGTRYDPDTRRTELVRVAGIFNTRRDDNPLRDYSVVFITYCTGDVHSGNADVEYEYQGMKDEVFHRGFVNATTALEYAYKNFPAPKELVIAGSSAGSYGTMFHTPYIVDHYGADTLSRLTVFGDAGIGSTVQSNGVFETWGTVDNLPNRPGFEAIDTSDFTRDYWTAIANTYPQAAVAQFTHADDAVQKRFATALSGDPAQWTAQTRAHLAAIAAAAPTFRYYIAPGDGHTILSLPSFYDLSAENVGFRNWFAAFVSGQPVESVTCASC